MLLNASKYHSCFGGLWTDMADAHEEVKAKLSAGIITDEERQLLDFWIDKGYVIIPNAVPHDVIDQINSDVEKVWNDLDIRVNAQSANYGSAPLNPSKRHEPGYRILDFYALYPANLKAIFADKIRRFIEIIFERDILAFQSLSFERGTQQAMHQDPAYVVLSSPMEMVATWIALEDIEPGSGELIYYEGSHRIEDFLFNGIHKHWDGGDLKIHFNFMESLHKKSEAMNLPLNKFKPKKGDVLIWAADLVHGGSEITHPNPNITRRSLVTHYCPNNVNPNYFSYLPEHRIKLKFKKGCYYSSSHYKLFNHKQEAELLELEFDQLRQEIELLQSTIRTMQSSKFWKLRNAWNQMKQVIRLK